MKPSMKLTLALGCGVMGCCAAMTPLLADQPASPVAHEAGIWQPHKYSFAFLGFTSTYSCDGLADKLKVLLLAAGARPDARARAGACSAPFGRPDKFARADLTFYTLAPASGAPGAGAPASDGPAVDGVWRQVALAARSPHELAVGDCELVEQFKSNVLPMFTTRNTDSRTTCIPNQDSGSVIDLKFDVLASASKADAAAARPAPAPR